MPTFLLHAIKTNEAKNMRSVSVGVRKDIVKLASSTVTIVQVLYRSGWRQIPYISLSED